MSKKSFGISSAPPPAACCLAPTLFAAPFGKVQPALSGKVQPALSAPFDKVQLSPQPFPSAPFDKVQHPPPFPSALFGKVQHPPPWFSAPFGKVQMPLPPMFFLLLLARCRPLCLLRLLLLLLARCSFPTAAAGCSPTGHHWLFLLLLLDGLGLLLFFFVVAKAKSLSLSAQAFWYLSFLAWLTVPLPACLPLLFLLAAIATLLPRVNYQPKGRHPFVKVVQPPH